MYTFDRTGCGGKIKTDKAISDAYNYFCKHYDNKHDITPRQYTQLFKEVCEIMMFHIIFKSYEWKLPASVGCLRIQQKPIKVRFTEDGRISSKGLNVDWASTKELWVNDPEAAKIKQRVFHFNNHTDRMNLRFYYDKRTTMMRNKSVYQFKPSRKWARLLNEAVKKNPNLKFFE